LLELLIHSSFLDSVSNITSLLCGRIAYGETVTIFNFPKAGQISIKETTFTEAEIGFQTWGGGIILASMLDNGQIDVRNKDVLELGSGTGLAGLVSGRMGSRKTIMTDYHPVVIKNSIINIEANKLSDNVRCVNLDWRWYDDTPNSEKREDLTKTIWPIIIAADCIFDFSHSELVPKVSKHYLSKDPAARFHVLLPHRILFQKEIEAFEINMIKEGWILEYNHWLHKVALTYRYYVYALDLTV
jgi:predicted nicotinamide N-methyase